MSKKIAISQSNYIPWKGYFDLINSVDEFVLYDDVQYTKRDWRNRNIIKTKDGLKWLTIPVETKGKFVQKINETRINNKKWAQDHWKAIQHSYSKTRCFDKFKNKFENTYLNLNTEMLSLINYTFINLVCEILEIRTKLSWSSDYELYGDQTERLINICRQAGANIYYAGPKAKNYLDEKKIKDSNIKLVYFDYNSYVLYRQLWGEFIHNVTILDLIFNEGLDAKKYMKSFNALTKING